MEWGGGPEPPPFVPHVKGFLCAGASAGKEHQGRDQAHIKTAGASGRELGGNNISGAETSFLGHHFSSSLNLSQFLPTHPSPLFIPFSPELMYLALWGTQGSASVTSPFHLTWGLLVQVSLHTLSHLGPSVWGLMFFKPLSSSGVTTALILLA